MAVFFEVSIHAPARGATKLQLRKQQPEWFQSTLPRGERQMLMSIKY